MMSEIKTAILQLIVAKGSVYNWMTLDRALSGQGFLPNVATVAAELERDGYIESMPSEIPAMPVYKITEKGRAALI
jgi:hypothetical protein